MINTGSVGARTYERSQSLVDRERDAIGDVMKIRFYPFIPVSANGTRITDADGNEYLDWIASAAVVQAGYGHPRIRSAIVEQLDSLPTTMHCCYPSPVAVDLAERLCRLMPGDFPKKAWFGTTGSDANDCVSRLAPMVTGRRRLISFVGSYHGQTTGSALLSGHQTQATVIGLGNVTKVPYPDPYRCMFGPCSRDGCSLKCLEHVERYALDTISPAGDTAAIVIESVQSDGGEVVPPANYLPALRELCDRHGIWLVFDEVKVGLGRTGKMFGFEHSGVVPDVVTLGKPLGGGLPLSAVVGRKELLDAPTYDLFTLGGSPLPCAAALATLDVIADEHLIENAAARGKQLLDGMEALKASHPLIGDVRGRGLIVGVELVTDQATREPAAKDAHRLAYRCFELGLIVIYAGIYGNVIEITPPLSISEAEIDEGLAIFERALADVEAGRFDDSKLAPYAGW
ncbi:MAG: 4-aminobutyrate aminotransferase [Gaiellales bacterium]|nr:4-aminobutyrate aminotransferase [Gaiellales bacterium]